MLTIASDAHRRHHPREPIHDAGRLVPPPEVPERAERILAALGEAGLGEIRAPDEFGPEPVLRVHTKAYVEFLETAHARWRAATGSPPSAEAVPYARADPRPAARRTAARDRQLGWYSHDSDPILDGTWEAATAAVDVALRRCARGRRRRCRRGRLRVVPAAGSPRCGRLVRGLLLPEQRGVAAQAWADRDARVAILDVDFHHGNGTQQFFYDRDDVLFVSLHADPADDYPYFLGFATERGLGRRRGLHPQLPAPARNRLGRVRPRARRMRSRRSRSSRPTGSSSRSASTPRSKTPTRFRLVADDYPRIGAAIGASGADGVRAGRRLRPRRVRPQRRRRAACVADERT